MGSVLGYGAGELNLELDEAERWTTDTTQDIAALVLDHRIAEDERLAVLVLLQPVGDPLDRLAETAAEVAHGIVELLLDVTFDVVLHPVGVVGGELRDEVLGVRHRGDAVSPTQRHMGFFATARRDRDGDKQFTGFLMNAKRSGHEVAGLSIAVSGQLVAAMEELENNIHEHAGAPETGILAYRSEPSAFEFVSADRGMGILSSLRRHSAHTGLPDAGKALEAALTDGVSHHGPNRNRGHEFRPIFTGLVNLHGELRFRSGDHSITMDGTSPALATSRISQKAPIDGFFASVGCHAR